MSTERLTPKAQLIDLLLRERAGVGLVDTLTAARDDHRTWRHIAREITHVTGHPVTYESLRIWWEDSTGVLPSDTLTGRAS